MPRSLLLLLPLALTACVTEDKEDTGGGPPPTCEVTIDETIPLQGAMDADYRAAIEFHLSDADSTAAASSTTITGASTLVDDDQTVIFTPSAPLTPNTAYTVTLDYCGGSAELSFTTGPVGTPVPDTSALVGLSYALDLADARIVEPAGIGSVLTSYLTQDILVGVSSVEGTEIQMLGAVGVEDADPPTQNYCDPSIDFPVADFSENPFFQIGPQTTTLSVAGYNIEIGDLEITGSFSEDGSYIAGATLAGTIDTRPLAPLLDDSGDPNAICALAVNFGAACEACPSDGEPYCLTLVADQITAEGIDGSLSAVSDSDCEGCESGPPAPDAVCGTDTGM